MGNYVFSADVLRRIVAEDAADETSEHDIGGNLIPMLVERGEAQVYDFSENEVPGATPRDRGYWRDVGTLDAFYEAHMDLISIDPVFNLYNREWPILTWHEPLPPAKFVFADEERMGHALDSMVCAGVVVSGGEVRRSVLSPSVHVHSYASVEDSVLMPGVHVGRGAVVKRAIVDKDVLHPPGRADRRRPRGRPRALHRLATAASSWSARATSWRPEPMRVALLTREYPPEVYGGAGVHVEYLARELARLEDLTVHCWGAERDAPGVRRAPRVGRAGRQRAAPRRAAGDVGRPRDGRRACRAPSSCTATPGTRTSPATWRS